MISFPNCKINLGLRILNKRNDGYHNLISVFYPVQWCDALEFIDDAEFSFRMEGLEVAGPVDNNLCVKAYRMLQKDYSLPDISMVLLKNIPTGAGLGGGSADGAFTLVMLNNYFELKLSASQLKMYALELGSDCPFFIENKPSLVTGKGEQLEGIDIDISGYFIYLVYPGITINTAWAFYEYSKSVNTLTSKHSSHDLKMQIRQPIHSWQHTIFNDFENIIFGFHPVLAMIRKQFYAAGALYSAMSGSGSSVYGIFEVRPETTPEFRNYRQYIGKL